MGSKERRGWNVIVREEALYGTPGYEEGNEKLRRLCTVRVSNRR